MKASRKYGLCNQRLNRVENKKVVQWYKKLQKGQGTENQQKITWHDKMRSAGDFSWNGFIRVVGTDVKLEGLKGFDGLEAKADVGHA